jgi:hypothetical protein
MNGHLPLAIEAARPRSRECRNGKEWHPKILPFISADCWWIFFAEACRRLARGGKRSQLTGQVLADGMWALKGTSEPPHERILGGVAD